MKPRVTHERLRQLLRYDPTTGAFTWLVNRGRMAKAGDAAGTVNTGGYVQIRVDGVIYLAHRLAVFFATGQWPTHHVDHQFGRRSDNRLGELRDLPQALNNQNRRHADRDSQTGLLGASPTGDGKFVAHITVDGKTKHLGRFTTAQAAHDVYVAAKRELHPAFVFDADEREAVRHKPRRRSGAKGQQ